MNSMLPRLVVSHHGNHYTFWFSNAVRRCQADVLEKTRNGDYIPKYTHVHVPLAQWLRLLFQSPSFRQSLEKAHSKYLNNRDGHASGLYDGACMWMSIVLYPCFMFLTTLLVRYACVLHHC